jgi:hypothetical protein
MEKHFVEIQSVESDEGLWRVSLLVSLSAYDQHPSKTSSRRFCLLWLYFAERLYAFEHRSSAAVFMHMPWNDAVIF